MDRKTRKVPKCFDLVEGLFIKFLVMHDFSFMQMLRKHYFTSDMNTLSRKIFSGAENSFK